MDVYSNIRQITIEDFKKIDINRILYVQLDTGEILTIKHTNNNKTKFKIKEKKVKKVKKDYTLSKHFYKGDIYINKPKSVEKINKRFNIIKGFKLLSDFSFQKKLKFYDNIPKRAKYWENESFDSSRSNFQIKRLKRQRKYYSYNYMNNYQPLSKDINLGAYDYYNNNYINKDNYNNINYNNQINPYMDSNYLYQLILGPFYPQYIQSQQFENYKNNQFLENNNYSVEDNYYNNNYNYYKN